MHLRVATGCNAANAVIYRFLSFCGGSILLGFVDNGAVVELFQSDTSESEATRIIKDAERKN